MDVYRIGTLLELAREMATALAQDGDHVKVCVQQSMGQGVFQVLALPVAHQAHHVHCCCNCECLYNCKRPSPLV